MKILEITDDSGFLGIINYHKYESYLSKQWDFELLKQHVVQSMNAHCLLFWATGLENTWRVKLDNQASDQDCFREAKGVIEVTDQKLYLTNYEALSMAAQFEGLQLPEQHHEGLFVDLENGKYMVKFRQLYNPQAFDFSSKEYHFEIVLMKIENMPYLYRNKLNEIYWYS